MVIIKSTKSPNASLSFIFISLFLSLLVSCTQHASAQNEKQPDIINMIFTSDAHYGIARTKFRGDSNVISHVVNAAMINQINSMPALVLPQNSGINAGNAVGNIDYIIEGGDIANRMETPIQNAAASWSQFEADYLNNIKLTAHNGKPVKFLLIPGNHDISNAIGFTKPMTPVTDPTSMVQIYNLMLKPEKPMTNQMYNYATDKINYARNIKGVHFMFITLWPDSAERIWMQKDLDTVAANTPVIIFTHDQPTCESKHFTNPLSPHNMTEKNKFQNLVAENYKEGNVAGKDDGATNIEQRGFVKFLKLHPNIKAYFHGNSNWNEFYKYKGPDNDVDLNVFRVDSPIKGEYSSKNETLLSFQLISIDPKDQILTVRECLWNTAPLNPEQKIVFGQTETVSVKVN